jgi:hypothetical protein
MTVIISGDDGVSDVDGSAGTPAIRGTDANTGIFFPAADTIAFAEGGAEAMRIDSSGNLLVGCTAVPSASVEGRRIKAGSGETTSSSGSSTSAYSHLTFINGNGAVGSVQTSASATSYNTSSDYRLKHDIQPMTGALAKVSALKPCTYKWNADDSAGEGFIAHELQDVVPDAVTGEKDAIETYLDEDGVEQTRPVYQGVDTSFLVATLTAAIQELKAINDAQASRIETLEAKVAALEANNV